MSIKSIPLNSLVRHVGLPLAALCCLLGVFFALKWYLANTISARAEQKELAQLAADLAPGDPQSFYALAVLDEKSFLPEDLSKSLAEFETATALSPNDYRLWFALGRARDRAGDAEGAEAAMRKALELAPHYAQVQWAFGNILLRRGKPDEAFAVMRKAVEGDATFANPAVSIAWQIFDGDVSRISQAVGDSPQAKSVLSAFLARQKRFDEAFAAWNALSEKDKKETYRQSGDELLKQLLQAKKFRDALDVQTQLAAPDAEKPAPEKITNAGFETAVNTASPSVFEWQIADGAQPVIGVDDKQKRNGNFSLVLAFNSPNGQDFRAVQQTVVVSPNKTYKFEVSFRSELKTSGSVKWEIVDAAADGKVLAATQAVPGSADWSKLTATFTAPAATEAVTIRLARTACTAPACPISGRIWFDDFRLE
ncbi:MAG: tetratricopeptide repeat protein [Acidobacteriota bacterium]|nr:tetratricopeptide repeat protein [Acidobacteriota bacterium]